MPPDLGVSPTLAQAIRRAAREFGGVEFIVSPSRRMTYAEADAASQRLARRMLAAGIGKGTRVGLLFTYGHEWVIAWLAASRIGALVMPFSTLSTPAELNTLLRRGDVHTLLAPSVLLGRDVHDSLEETIPELSAQRGSRLFISSLPYLRSIWMCGPTDRVWATPVDVEGGAGSLEVDDALLEAAEAEVCPADLAIVVHTSGSSAEPKGVIHTHGTVMRASAFLGPLHDSSGDHPATLLCAMPFFWVGGILCLAGALQGAMTVLVMERFDPAMALAMVEQERAVGVAAWSSLIEAMRSDPSFESRDVSCAPLLCEAPHMATAGNEPHASPHRGMSETMGTLTAVECKVVDPRSGHPLAEGEEGELLVRGHGLMAGYYRREREDVFDDDGWYRTGDRAFIHEGRTFFNGRYTEMIKSQGANVAPLEVEQMLQTLPGIRHAFVVGMPHAQRGEEVTAVLVAAPGVTIDPAAVRDCARKELSAYKVPTRIKVVEEEQVPWLASGKPDKRALRRLLDRSDIESAQS